MEELFELECPACRCRIWVDSRDKTVVEYKRSEKMTHSSLEDLLLKEKEKKEKVEERFKKADELQKAKKRQAEEIFLRSLQKKQES